jgi:hypothetical protein
MSHGPQRKRTSGQYRHDTHKLSECRVPFEDRILLLREMVAKNLIPVIGGPNGFEWEDLVSIGYAKKIPNPAGHGRKKHYVTRFPYGHSGYVSALGRYVRSNTGLCDAAP